MSKSLFIVTLVLSVCLAFGIGGVLGYVNAPVKTITVAAQQPAGPQGTTVQLPDGRTITAAPGSAMRVYVKEPDRGAVTSDRLGISKGGFARGTTATTGLNTQAIAAPSVDLTEGEESGTAGMFNTKLKNAATSGTTMIIVVGIILIIAGIAVIVIFKLTTIGMWLMIAGGVLIGVGLLVQSYPWVLLIGALVAVAIVGFFLYRSWKGTQTNTTLATIIAGIEKAPADIQAAIKAWIASTGNEATRNITKKVVSQIKRSL